ncbi:hypothetical protein N7478_002601 [Penicillium angulare]|uniref:uncharacterized protein n=1 Tax=Penicillium angulare TaxID=116970 RepID=UPI00253F7AE5|nr:uncharacterized protein N7478_002601 [Penicillium angulare]KAJ5286915.1 hypothetical protein N7478_002601 [Penicillium angulare]
MVSSSDDVAASKPAPAPSDLTRSPQLPQPDTASPESIYHTSILKECLDSSLEFLSHASNERLLGVLSLLFIGTYVILGRVGLILIGAALGVILHASWEGPTSANNGDDGLPISTRRPKLALEVSKRLLDWSLHQPSATDNDGNNGNLVAAPEDLTLSDLEFSSFQPLTAAALRSFTDAVINDYVK